MTNEISQNEKIILDLTNNILLSGNKRFKEKGIAFRVEMNTSQEDPYESKITIDLIYDDEIIDFIEFYVYEKGGLVKNEEVFKIWFNDTLNETYQNLIQYD
jgi:hypothetical protein